MVCAVSKGLKGVEFALSCLGLTVSVFNPGTAATQDLASVCSLSCFCCQHYPQHFLY